MSSRCVLPQREARCLSLRQRSTDPLANERGSITAGVIILPLVMLSIVLGIHFSMVLHGRSVARAAAQDAVQAAQLQLATGGNGHQAAQNTLAMFPAIRDAQISINMGVDTVSVTIRGSVDAPIGLFNDFEVTRSGPLERFYFESERE